MRRLPISYAHPPQLAVAGFRGKLPKHLSRNQIFLDAEPDAPGRHEPESDFCGKCDRITRWDGDACTRCGREWGVDW